MVDLRITIIYTIYKVQVRAIGVVGKIVQSRWSTEYAQVLTVHYLLQFNEIWSSKPSDLQAPMVKRVVRRTWMNNDLLGPIPRWH